MVFYILQSVYIAVVATGTGSAMVVTLLMVVVVVGMVSFIVVDNVAVMVVAVIGAVIAVVTVVLAVFIMFTVMFSVITGVEMTGSAWDTLAGGVEDISVTGCGLALSCSVTSSSVFIRSSVGTVFSS